MTSAGDNKPIPQHSAISQLQIFPNPSDGNFQLHYWLSKPFKYSLKIADSTGHLIQTKNISHISVGEQVENLTIEAATGVYFITIESEKEVITRKIIID